MDKKSVREIVVASSLYSIGSIFGPLLVFGGFGYILDRVFDTYPWSLLIGVFIAFIVTNVLLYKKVKKINGMIESYRLEAIEKEKLDKKE